MINMSDLFQTKTGACLLMDIDHQLLTLKK